MADAFLYQSSGSKPVSRPWRLSRGGGAALPAGREAAAEARSAARAEERLSAIALLVLVARRLSAVGHKAGSARADWLAGRRLGLLRRREHDGSVPLLLVMSDWLDLPLIWVYLAVCVAALRGVTSGVTQAMLPRALVADGSGNAPIRVSADGKAGYISTTLCVTRLVGRCRMPNASPSPSPSPSP